jgi:hypothetical protein
MTEAFVVCVWHKRLQHRLSFCGCIVSINEILRSHPQEKLIQKHYHNIYIGALLSKQMTQEGLNAHVLCKLMFLICQFKWIMHLQFLLPWCW